MPASHREEQIPDRRGRTIRPNGPQGKGKKSNGVPKELRDVEAHDRYARVPDALHAPAPKPGAPEEAGWAGPSRLAGQKALEILSQSLGAGVAEARLLLQAFQANGLQGA